jgi:hypothetical protein
VTPTHERARREVDSWWKRGRKVEHDRYDRHCRQTSHEGFPVRCAHQRRIPLDSSRQTVVCLPILGQRDYLAA